MVQRTKNTMIYFRINQLIIIYAGIRFTICDNFNNNLQLDSFFFFRMGCGALVTPQVAQNKHTIVNRIRNRLIYIRSKQLYKANEKFINEAEILQLQNSLTNVHQVLSVDQIKSLEAGEPCLLSKERRLLWKIAILNFDVKQKDNHHTYCENPFPQSQSSKHRFYQIDLDTNRTFTTVQQLDKKQLTKVLQNLTLYFQGVGYTQGMNFVTGFLLLCGFTPLQTYQIFIKLSYSKHFLLIRNFTEHFQNVKTLIRVLQIFIQKSDKECLKQTKIHIQNHGLNFFMFIFSWFMTYFAYNCNLRSIVLIWDYLILVNISPDTQKPSFQVRGPKPQVFGSGLLNSLNLSIQILQQLSTEIVNCQSPENLMQIIRSDSIQKYLTQTKTVELIAKCRDQPYINWPTFLEIIQKQDPSMSSIIKGKKNNIENSQELNHLDEFINTCTQNKVKT